MVNKFNRFLEDKQLTRDIIFDILSHKRRRYALYCLERYRTPMALPDLADEVARLEHDAETLVHVPEDNIKRIYCDLYHSHIPKMEEANLLEYSQEQDAVHLKFSLSGLNLEEMI